MAKKILAIVQHGETLVVQQKDGSFGGSTVDVLTIDGETGKPTWAIAPTDLKVHTGYVAYTPPAPEANAAGATLVANANLANSAATIAAQPAVPCKLNLFVTDANNSVSGTIKVVGVGAAGEALTEVINVVAANGTHTYTTLNAYATITSVTPNCTGINVGTDKLAVGQATAVGLPIPEGSTGVTVYKEAVGATIASVPVDEAAGTVDGTARTVVPTTAADGTKALFFWFRYLT